MEIDKSLTLIQSVKSLIDKELPLVSNLANLSRLFFEYFKNTSWAGFYLKKENEDTLYLGPFQGPVACTLIPFNKGVCGTSAFRKESILVEDVNKFKGHIACSSLSRSEVVVPIIKNDICVGVIDLDSNLYNNFSIKDKNELEEVANIIKDLF